VTASKCTHQTQWQSAFPCQQNFEVIGLPSGGDYSRLDSVAWYGLRAKLEVVQRITSHTNLGFALDVDQVRLLTQLGAVLDVSQYLFD
jgi:hypothetical protein